MRTGPARVPQQERSQRSLEQALKAAEELLIEEGYEGFSLRKVSSRSGVSTGSIYARVDSKDDLVHIVAARLIEARWADHEQFMVGAREITALPELIAYVIPGYGEILRRHSPLLRPLLLRAPYDEQLLDTHRSHAKEVRDDIVAMIAAHRDEIVHPRPDDAPRIVFSVASDAVFLFLGLGTRLIVPDMRGWDQLLDDLVDIAVRVLCGAEFAD